MFCVCSDVLSHRALWEKHCINNNKIIKGMSMREQEEGGGKGDFGSNTSSFRASVLPSTPSSLSQMGLDSELEAALEIIQPGPSLSHMRKLKPTDVK